MSTEKASSLASTIMADFTKVRDGVMGMSTLGISSNAVLYNGASPFIAANPAAINDAHALASRQVFSPVYGTMSAPTPNLEAITPLTTATQKIYLYRVIRAATSGGAEVGSTAADVVMFLANVESLVCDMINVNISDSGFAGGIPSGTIAIASITGGGTPQISNSGTVTPITGTFIVPAANGNPRTTGCVTDGAGTNIAYQIVVAN